MSLVLGFLLVTAGIIFLANNFGIVPAVIWKVLFKFWPVLMIGLGLSLLVRNRALALLLFLALLVGALILALSPAVLNRLGVASLPRELPSPSSEPSSPEISGETETATKRESLPIGQTDQLSLKLTANYQLKIQGSDTDQISIDIIGPKTLVDRLHFAQQDKAVVIQEQRSPLHFFSLTKADAVGTITIPKNLRLDLEIGGIAKAEIADHNGPIELVSSGVGSVSLARSLSRDPKLLAAGTSEVHLDGCQGTAEMTVKGTAQLTATACHLDRLTLNAAGASHTTLAGSVKDLKLKASGVASVRLPKPTGKIEQETTRTAEVHFEEKEAE